MKDRKGERMKGKSRKSKAVAYLRVSGLGQVDRGGFSRQKRAIENYAKGNRIELVETYRDEGVSGVSELENRPALARMLDRLENNGIKVVLIERADRLARDLTIQEILIGQLREHGIKVLDSSGTDLSDNSDPTRKLIRQVLGAVAEYDKNITVLKLRAARDRKRRQTGKCEGRKPYGFFEGEPEVLEEMRRLRMMHRGTRRWGYSRIAKELNERGIPSRTGGKWYATTVQKILERAGYKE